MILLKAAFIFLVISEVISQDFWSSGGMMRSFSNFPSKTSPYTVPLPKYNPISQSIQTVYPGDYIPKQREKFIQDRWVNCMSNFYLPSRKSFYEPIVCTKCDQYFVKINDRMCIPIDPFCEIFATNTTCSVCKPGFTIGKGGFCIRDLRRCLDIDRREGSCRRCQQGYIVVNNGCADQRICRSYSLSVVRFYCVSCAPGFEAYNGFCFSPTSKGCKTMGNAGRCLECLSSQHQVLENGQCMSRDKWGIYKT